MILVEGHTMPFMFLPKGKEVLCEVIFPVGTLMEGDRENLLEIVEEIDHTVLKTGYNKFVTMIYFDED